MNNQTLVIHEFKILYEILFELENHINFRLINIKRLSDFNFKTKPNPETLKLICDKFQIPTSKETLYIEDIAKNLSSETAKDMIKVWFMNEEPINDLDKYKHVIDYKIDNLALFLKKIRLLKEA